MFWHFLTFLTSPPPPKIKRGSKNVTYIFWRHADCELSMVFLISWMVFFMFSDLCFGFLVFFYVFWFLHWFSWCFLFFFNGFIGLVYSMIFHAFVDLLIGVHVFSLVFLSFLVFFNGFLDFFNGSMMLHTACFKTMGEVSKNVTYIFLKHFFSRGRGGSPSVSYMC